MKNLGKKLLFISLFAWITAPLMAQDFEEENECVRTLDRAQKAYDDGLIEKVEQMVTPCLNSTDLTKDDKLRGYKLLALAHTYDGKDAEAESAMKEFLKLDPEYQPLPGVDPKEFFELYNSYHTSPLYTIGVLAGPNFSMVQSYREFGAYNTGADTKEFSSRLGFQIGARFTRYIYQGLNVHLDLVFVQNSFEYTQDVLEGYTQVEPNADPAPLSPTKGSTIESIETHTSLIFPLSFSYTFLRNKQIRPYVLAGLESRLLLGASNSITKSYFDQDIASVEASDIDNFKEERNSFTLSGIVGLGAKYKIKGGDIFLEAKYNIGISDQVNRDATSINDDQRLWTFYQQDNDFTLNTLMINAGYTMYLYKPRKIKNQRAPKTPKKEKPKKEKTKDGGDTSGKNKRQVIE